MDRSGYCGKCLRQYTRKENWLKHFDQKNVQGVEGTGRAPNVCYGLPTNSPRVWEKTKEKAKKAFLLAQNAQKFFKTNSDCNSGPSTAKVLKRPHETAEVVDGEPVKGKKLRGDESDDSDEDDHVQDDEEPDFGIVSVVSDENIGESRETVETNIDKVFALLNTIRESQVENNTVVLQRLENLGTKTNVGNVCGEPPKTKSVFKTVSEPEDRDIGDGIEPDKHFTESMLSLKHATSMYSVMNNSLIREDFELRTIEQVGENSEDEERDATYELYCLGCSDKSLRGLQGQKQRATSFKVKDPNYTTSPQMPKWFRNLKMSLRRHLNHISHHQLTTSYNLLKTRRFQSTSSIRRLRLNLLYFIMKTNSSFTLYPVLLAVLSRCGQEVGNKNSSRFVLPKILDLLGTLNISITDSHQLPHPISIFNYTVYQSAHVPLKPKGKLFHF